jgi:xanthine dehydrogenase small subunit
MRNKISFTQNGKLTEISDFKPTDTLLDYLRLKAEKKGTKEGCNEGDCGACTIMLGEVKNGELVYRPANSCITLLGMVDGQEVITIDDLAEPDGTLHPLQQSFTDFHASQCGFCTPGFIMALLPLYQNSAGNINRQQVTDQLAGNLCRCTGYRPIVQAALTAFEKGIPDKFNSRREKTANLLASITRNDGASVFIGDETAFFAAPASINELAELYTKHSDATLVAGATDVGLWITKSLIELPKIIWLGKVQGFNTISDSCDALEIGGGVTYAKAEESLAAIDPDVGEIIRRIGSKQVRASGTIGGNIANGSPIGDTPPLLIALNAQLTLQQSLETRTIPLEDFFIDYGKQDRKEGEFVRSIKIPKLQTGEHLRTYKISKRFDQDISALLFALCVTVNDQNIITDVRLAMGGMAATPKRAPQTEAALIGAQLTAGDAIDAATIALANDFTPISDMRASSAYRIKTAQNLLRKAMIELAADICDLDEIDTRIIPRHATSVEIAK